jgi:hypothetical protein
LTNSAAAKYLVLPPPETTIKRQAWKVNSALKFTDFPQAFFAMHSEVLNPSSHP